jgi:O-antigen ligase
MTSFIGYAQKFPLQRSVPLLLAATLLVLPISSTGKSICLSLSVIAIVLVPDYRSELIRFFAKEWCKAAILLFCVAVVASLWSPASNYEKMYVIEKYSKLLYLPILVVGFREARTRQMGLHAFLLAMLITCFFSILKFCGYLPTLAIEPDSVFRNHILTSSMVASAAYLSLLFAFRQQGIARLLYGILALLFSYQMLFINGSRTGYIIYLLLMMLFIIQVFSWRQAIFGVFLISTAFAISYSQSVVLKERVNLMVSELIKYKENDDKNTAVGYRLQFHKFAHQLYNRHPLLGNGTSSFRYYFRAENPVPAWAHELMEPHSQYWLIAAEFGIFGLAALLFLFLSLIKASWHLDSMRPIAFAILLPFFLGNLSDSLLFYSGSGYLFILFMAMCLGEQP